MAEIAGSRSIFFGKGMFEPITDGISGVRVFQNESPFRFGQGELSDSLKRLSGETATLRLKANNGGQQPKDVWAGIVGGVKSFMSNTDAFLGTEVPYESADHKLGIAFSANVDVLTPAHIGPERKAHLERCGQRITDIIQHAKLVQLTEGYMAAGKQLDEQWLRDTFNTTLPSGLRDILREYGDSLKSVMGEAYENVAFGKLPEKKVQAMPETRSRITVSRGTPAILQETTAAHVFTVPSMFQAVTAENALTAPHLTTMDKVNISAGVVLVGFGSLAACSPAGPVMPTETIQIPSANLTPDKPNSTAVPTTKPTEQKPASTSTNPVASGPEATPGASSEYPARISLTEAQTALSKPEIAVPSEILTNPGVAEILQKETELLRAAGVNVDDPTKEGYVKPTIHMLSNGTNWTITLDKADGTIGAWGTLKDTASKTGDSFMQSCTYDSKMTQGAEVAGARLPELTDAQNHFDWMDLGGSDTLLVEVKPDGTPVNWYNYNLKTRVSFTDGKPISEPTPTVEAHILKAGIPETKEECNVMDLQLNADGTIKRDAVTSYMTDLSKVEHQWMLDKGITVADVPVFSQNGVSGTDGLPYPHIDMMGRLIPTSCTKITYQGHEYFMYGFAGKHNESSTQVAIFHVIYDDVGNESFLNMLDQKDYYDTHYSSNVVFDNVRTKPGFKVQVFVGAYGQSDKPEDIERWQLAQAINKMNKNVLLHGKDVDEQLAILTTVTRPFESGEEAQFITDIEQAVFAAQTIGALNLPSN